MGSLYLDGKIDFTSLYYHCAGTARDARWYPGDSRIKEIIFEWEKQTERARNEWPGWAEDPISEDEFRSWLKTQRIFK